MTKVTKVALALLVIAAIVVIVWFIFRSNHTDKPTVTLYGNIDIRQVDLSFHDAEHIKAIYVQEGERVKQGQLLAEQDLERFQYAIDRAQASLEVQQQTLNRLLSGSRAEEIAKAKADVKGAQADVRFARKELERLQALSQKKLVSMEAVDHARTQRDSALAKLKALQELQSLAVIGPREEDILAAKAQLKADTAALNLANKVWRDGHLVAPHDGIIRNRILEPGDMANAQTPVLTLALIDPVWVRAYVSEIDLGKLRLGMSASIFNDSHPGKRYDGWVGYISPTAEFTPKAVETTELRTSLVYQVRVYACNPQNQLRLGMPVTVTIDLEQTEPDSPVGCASSK